MTSIGNLIGNPCITYIYFGSTNKQFDITSSRLWHNKLL